MTLKAEDFGSGDLETLVNMGITADKSGRLRIGHAVAKEMGLGGGRWLKKEEDAKVPAAIKGYTNPDLPESIKTSNAYSTIEKFHLAAEAANGVPSFGEKYVELTSSLEEQLGVSRGGIKSDGVDGLPTRSIIAAYVRRNNELRDKKYGQETFNQFIDGLVDSVERTINDAESSARTLIDTTKAMAMTEPAGALKNAVEATYLQTVVAVVRPQVDAIKKISYSPANEKQQHVAITA